MSTRPPRRLRYPILTQTYTGLPLSPTATTTPGGLSVCFLYDNSLTPPTNTGSYDVVATISDPHYQGTVTGTLWVQQAVLAVTEDDQRLVCGGDVPTLTYTVAGYQNGDGKQRKRGNAGLSTAATAASPAGSYPINVDVSA